MQKIILLSIVLLSMSCFSQSKMIVIEYEIFYNTDLPNTQYATLYIDQPLDKSIYKQKNKVNDNKVLKKDGENTVNVRYNSKKNNYNYFNFRKDTLISAEGIFGEDYIIAENVPRLNWKLVSEEKVKDSIHLSRAECQFRGRKYIAWYATEYPLKYGPWKLQGLPGLIFEVYDETRRYNWYLKKITYEPLNESIFILDIDNIKQIDLQEYAKIKFYNESIDEKLLTKMPRGTSIISSEIFRYGLEIKFEWEE